MNAQQERSDTGSRDDERPGPRRIAVGLAWGLTAVSILTACGDHSGPRTISESRPPTSMSVPAETPEASPSEAGAGGSLPDGLQTAALRPAEPPTPEETRSAWSEGVALYGAGDFGKASLRLEVASIGRPDDPYVQYLFGLALWKSGHLDESEAALMRSASLDDASERTFVNLARVRLERKDFPGALEASDRALAIRSGSAPALHQRGRALDGLNRGDEARDALQQARAADPGNGYIANTLGYLLLRQGRTDEAVVELEAAREAIPQVAYVRNNLGVAYERKGEIEKAAEEFRAAVDAGDPDGKAAVSLARLEPIRERLSRRADAAAPDR